MKSCLCLLSAFFIFSITNCVQPAEEGKTISTAGKQSINHPFMLANFLVAEATHHPVEVVHIPLTPDTIPDFFIIDYFGISTGYFFDGQTGREIPDNGVYIPSSRPGVDLEYKVIDVGCGDHQKELLVKYGAGGTAGLYLGTQVYRFDKETNEMKMIFEETYSDSHYNDEGDEITDTINFIDFKYDGDSCINQVAVSRGRYSNRDRYTVIGNGIVPIKTVPGKIYRFNLNKNNFELVKDPHSTK